MQGTVSNIWTRIADNKVKMISPKRRQSHRKMSQELVWKIIHFRADYTHAKMASRKGETHQIKPRI